jgi:DNA modification methylase
MTWEIRQGDCLEVFREMPAESVQTCITSPPYFGLRDYGTGRWEGGDGDCDHDEYQRRRNAGSQPSTGAAGNALRDGAPPRSCKCGAKRIDSQLGLEPTPEGYVANLIAVFREVRRVLRDDGTVWLNLGDSYAATVKGSGGTGKSGLMNDGREEMQRLKTADASNGRAKFKPRRFVMPDDAKPKDILGIPWMVAFALRADGWYLRSDIIWAKPNPMPESVTDRPTRAHEYIFLLTKNARYFFDSDAIRETDSGRPSGNGFVREHRLIYQNGDGSGRGQEEEWTPGGGRNKRSVWTVTTQPYPDAHFATFPPKLVEPCILAGSRPDDTVLDPFCGSGTVGLVALRHDRSFIGIELNPDYCEMARNRIRDDAPLLNTGLEVAARPRAA